jgi:dATP pyrophosphohydrolase
VETRVTDAATPTPDAAAPVDERRGHGTKIPESVLVVIHTREWRVLLLERIDAPGFWQSVTGSKDALDEPLEATCVREVLEETGIDARAHELVDWRTTNRYEIYPQWRWRYPEGITHNVEHVFGLRLAHEVPVTIAPREHRAFAWLPWQEAAARCFSPSNAEAIRALPTRSAAGVGRPAPGGGPTPPRAA